MLHTQPPRRALRDLILWPPPSGALRLDSSPSFTGDNPVTSTWRSYVSVVCYSENISQRAVGSAKRPAGLSPKGGTTFTNATRHSPRMRRNARDKSLTWHLFCVHVHNQKRGFAVYVLLYLV